MPSYQEISSDFFQIEQPSKSDFAEGLVYLAKELTDLTPAQIIKRLTLNVGYETYKTRRVLKELGITMSFKEVKKQRDSYIQEWKENRQKYMMRKCRTGRTKFKDD